MSLPDHYRYDAYQDPYTNEVILEVYIFKAIKETPGGYWLQDKGIEGRGEWSQGWILSKPKWVPKYSRKRFAYPTKEEALTSFIARKRKQIEYLARDLNLANSAFKAATGKDYEEMYAFQKGDGLWSMNHP